MTSLDIISPCRLNDDVLREIFIHCVSDDGKSFDCFVLDKSALPIHIYPQLSVTRVCSSWRHIAFLTPRLWNNIMIGWLTESNLSIAKRYLSHARNLPISITFGPDIAMENWPLQLTDFLSSYRLRSLQFPGIIPSFHTVLRDLPERSVEDLESLEIYYNHYLKDEAAIDLNDNRYPKLAFLGISGTYNISGCSSSLRIFDGTQLSMTVSESWDLLSRCPSLEKAQLRMIPDDGSQRQLSEPQIYHQCLRTLMVESTSEDDEIPFSVLIAPLALPGLETLHVFDAVVAWSVTAFQSLAQRSDHFPNLSDFFLSCPTFDVDAGALLTSMPYVTSFFLMCYPFDAVFDQRALSGLASGLLAPRLQCLVACTPNGIEFMDMVELRMKNAQISSNGVPAPFTKIEIPFYSEDVVVRSSDMRRRGIPIHSYFI